MVVLKVMQCFFYYVTLFHLISYSQRTARSDSGRWCEAICSSDEVGGSFRVSD